MNYDYIIVLVGFTLFFWGGGVKMGFFKSTYIKV